MHPKDCPSGKVWFRVTWKARLALRASQDLARTNPGRGVANSYYLCRECGCYHLTRQAPNRWQGNYGVDEEPS